MKKIIVTMLLLVFLASCIEKSSVLEAPEDLQGTSVAEMYNQKIELTDDEINLIESLFEEE